MWKPKTKENHGMFFLYKNQDYIHLIYDYQLKGRYKPLDIPSPTGRKHQVSNL